MKLYFSGAEVGAHRKRFAKQEIRRVGFNLGPVLNSGGHSSVAPDDLLPFVTLFYASQTVDVDKAAEVMRAHGDETSLAIGMEYSGRFPGTAIPLWNGVDIDVALEAMVEHGSVCIEEADLLEKRNQIPLNTFVARNPSVHLYCATSKVEALALPCLTDAIVAGWIATQKHREFQVWDGKKVRKFPRTARSASVDNYAGQINNMGGDVEKLKAGDVDEMVRMSLLSWQQYERILAIAPLPYSDATTPEPVNGVAIARPQARPRERVLLPVLGHFEETDHGNVARTSINALRQCNGCFIAHSCPGYETDAACAYAIPVEIRTVRQMRDAQQLVHEIQWQRILFMRHAEEAAGGELDPHLGKEMDRFFSQAESVARQNEQRSTLTIQTTESGGGSGILASIFGGAMAKGNQALPQPVASDTVLAEAWEADTVDSK